MSGDHVDHEAIVDTFIAERAEEDISGVGCGMRDPGAVGRDLRKLRHYGRETRQRLDRLTAQHLQLQRSHRELVARLDRIERDAREAALAAALAALPAPRRELVERIYRSENPEDLIPWLRDVLSRVNGEKQ